MRGRRAPALRHQCRPTAYDALLNSPVGLRAQYATSPEAGENANRTLCEGLRARLLLHLKLAEFSELERTIAQRSIASAEARLWVNDRDWSTAEGPGLRYGPWANNAALRTKALPPNSRREASP